MKHRVHYEQSKKDLMVEDIRTGKCLGDHRVNLTYQHHWEYIYTMKQLLKHPELYNEGTAEVCFNCHRVCNALSLIAKFAENHPERFQKLFEAMPQHLKAVLQKAMEASR